MTYYNEHDPGAAAWLRELIKAGLISAGDVDERSIEDVLPNELTGYIRCHFFAGVGVWDCALNRAGWPAERPVWTGSCPCQPFSAAGKGKGAADERHLWPAFFHLIEQCRPVTVFGEQVASRDGLAWLDLVQADLEGAGYACGAVDTCAAGFGAPHIRQRLYFVAQSNSDGRTSRGEGSQAVGYGQAAESDCSAGSLDNAQRNRWDTGRDGQLIGAAVENGIVGHPIQPGLEGHSGHEPERHQPGRLDEDEGRSVTPAGPTGGFWRGADWLYCRDEKYRAVEPGTFPLAYGPAALLVQVCADCIPLETRSVNEDMRELFEASRWSERRREAEVLLPNMPFTAQNTASKEQEHWSSAGPANVRGDSLPTVRFKQKTSASSQGQEPGEQCAGEHRDTVLKMPPSGTHDGDSAFDLRGMQNIIQSRQPPKQKQDLQCDLCGRVGSGVRKAQVGSSRVVRLRGYGNAIVAPQAEAFVRASMVELARRCA